MDIVQHDEKHLRDYLLILVKRRQIAASVFAIIVATMVAYLYSVTPIYQGSAKLMVNNERSSTLTFGEGGTAIIQQKNMDDYYISQAAIIKSRMFADRVVRKLQLDKHSYFKELKGRPKIGFKATISSYFADKADKSGERKTEKSSSQELDPFITDQLLQNISLETDPHSSVMQIRFTATNAAVAAEIANGIALEFIANDLDMKLKPARDAAEWLSSRLVESRAKVGESESTLQRYREGKGIVSFESKENVINQKLTELTSQYLQAENKRQEAELKYRQIQSVIDKPELLTTVSDVMNNAVVTALRTDELSLRRQISELSEKYGDKHPQITKTKSQLEMVKNNINLEARKMLGAAKSDFDLALSRQKSISRVLEEQKREVLDLSRKAIDFNVIAGESGSNRQFYDLLLKKLQEASLTAGMSVTNIHIIDHAAVNNNPIKPNSGKILKMALMLGLFGGIFVVMFVEYMDDTIKTAEEIDRAVKLPLLDIVPLTDISSESGSHFVLNDPKSNAAEAFRTIRTGIMLSALNSDPLKVLLVTSATPNEGKSTVATNLAVAMSQMGERVLLIDVDMRRHNLHEFFDVDNSIGISDLLMDSSQLSVAVKKIEKIPNLYVLTGGSLAPNPSELLGTDLFRSLIAAMRDKYDRVILDSPPLMAFSDSLVLSRLSDGVILVLWGAKTPRSTFIKAADSLKGVGARIIGVVMNKIDTTRHLSYGYYSYYYSDKKGSKKNKK